MLENVNWGAVLTALLGAAGGGGLVAKLYGGGRKVKDDLGTDRAKSAAEATWRQTIADKNVDIADLRAEIIRLHDELRKQREEKKVDDKLYDEQVAANTELRRRLGLVARRDDIYTDLGAGLKG